MKLIKSIFVFLLILIVSACLLAYAHGYLKFKEAIGEISIEDKVSEIQSIPNYTKIDEIPRIYVDSVVSVEDRRFYTHEGFDLVGTFRAFWVNFSSKALKEGGSTITQQLAKNMYFPLDNTLERKVAEVILALEIEKKYSKDEILELYFNIIYYGSGYYNIHDASYGYFGKPPSEMNEYESTLLAGVPNAPSVYSPKVNLELAHKRQEKVVSSLVDNEIISDDDAKRILSFQIK